MRFFQGVLLLTAVLAGASHADPQREIPEAREIEQSERSQQFGSYTVHFSVFNSAFVPPKVAQAYGITRARDQALINISVTKTESGQTSLGLPAQVSGTAKNLIQQLQTLKFREVDEGNATYYIAPLKHSNEEMYHFAIDVAPEGAEQSFTVNFSRKLYRGEDS
ncbi:DUF4426 domain-containing protein [Gilvimarinus algae]|uniref:DUF4426 domain-containing protein n=1 Tax=Gilvimarinus algae TaxID=3058037 RepID=A0ABT8TGE8_9GAMM|nr:DUF4426 domain-containing protein [Gilvimarinus sp. SDUM040014]MDO3383165.1 DUF4426 domain-containing protein [Gilvimarinus sp. SDUM040014]